MLYVINVLKTCFIVVLNYNFLFSDNRYTQELCESLQYRDGTLLFEGTVISQKLSHRHFFQYSFVYTSLYALSNETILIQDRFVAGHENCVLCRHLDSVPTETPIRDIVD